MKNIVNRWILAKSSVKSSVEKLIHTYSKATAEVSEKTGQNIRGCIILDLPEWQAGIGYNFYVKMVLVSVDCKGQTIKLDGHWAVTINQAEDLAVLLLEKANRGLDIELGKALEG